MKKILTLFALLVLTVTGAQAQSEYSGIEISFNRSAATETNFTNFTVVVKDLDGNAISGVTAEPVSVAASDNINSTMGGAAAVSWTEKILVGGRYSNNNYSSAAAQDFVFKISGLRTGFAFNKAEVDLYGCNQAGAAVSSAKVEVLCAIQTGNAADNLSAFVSSTGNKINGSQEGGLWHKVTTMKAAAEKTVAANEDLYVKVTIQKTADGDGTKCRPSFRTVKLSLIPMHAVTYQVVDANNTSTVLASLTKNEEEGSTITTFPNELYRNAFYTYTAVPETTVDAAKTITIQATLKDNAPVKYTTDATDPIYYNMKIRGQYLVYDATVTDEVKLQTTSEPFNSNAAWAFVGTPYDGFKVINETKGTSYPLTYTEVTTARPTTHNIQFQTGAEAEAKVWLIETNNNSKYPGGIVLRMKENTSIYFHHENGNTKYLRTCAVAEWSNVHDDEGSTIILTTDETALIDLYDALAAVPFGDGLNEYGSTDADFAQKLAAVKDDIDNKNIGSYATDYATLQDLQASLSLNLPETGFYRIKGYSGNYMTFNAEGTNAAMSGTAGDNNIVCYTPDKKLVFFVNGLGMYNTSEVGAAGATLNTYTFLEGAQKGHYYIKSNASNMGTYCYDNTANGTKVDRNSSPVTSGSYQTDWTLEPVTELTITLNAVNGKYYRTFSAPVDIATITGATMNNVTVAPDNKTAETVVMTASDGLKAGYGVVLIGESATATATIGAAQASATTNLKPQYASEPASAHANHYFLGTKTSNSEKVVGFYLLKDTGKTGGFKAYIEKNASTAKEGFDLVFGNEVTGINTIENAADNGAVFNLQGQRVNKAQKGVYIQNGKKVVLK